jgi:adenine-specific DNA methylase
VEEGVFKLGKICGGGGKFMLVDKISYVDIVSEWEGSSVGKESTLHQISPYIGKMKSTMAKTLITKFSKENDTVYDPFSGSGNIALEAWIGGRNAIACDLNPYAVVITKAKLFPVLSLDEVLDEIDSIGKRVDRIVHKVDIDEVSTWVRSFFNPDTLREIVAWIKIIKNKKSYFLLASLLGILHHQRPGFLSFPSSHTVPYLRSKKFPQDTYPELYQYRSVRDRLERKVNRVLKRIPELDFTLTRECYMRNASTFKPKRKVNVIITSPPYMKQLDYGRDNRLRLWFVEADDWKMLDRKISPSENDFIELMKRCFVIWHSVLVHKGLCVIVVGDAFIRTYKMTLSELLIHLATKEIGGYSLLWTYREPIPDIRRVRRNCSGSRSETILVFRNNKGKSDGR